MGEIYARLGSEIRVTFSKDMLTDRMSWVQASGDTFPETTGEAKWLPDQRTCVLPVSLKPGRAYAIWFNADRYRSFQDTNEIPAVPYLLIFETKK